MITKTIFMPSNDLKLKKDTVFITRINSRIKDKLAEIAAGEGLTMTEYFHRLLIQDLKKRKAKIEVKEMIY